MTVKYFPHTPVKLARRIGKDASLRFTLPYEEGRAAKLLIAMHLLNGTARN